MELSSQKRIGAIDSGVVAQSKEGMLRQGYRVKEGGIGLRKGYRMGEVSRRNISLDTIIPRGVAKTGFGCTLWMDSACSPPNPQLRGRAHDDRSCGDRVFTQGGHRERKQWLEW